MTLVTAEIAIRLLDEGRVVALPTETVYGLAGRIDRPAALLAIFTTKDRPFFDPLIVHGANFDQLRSLVENVQPVHEWAAGTYWPGPLTMVLPKSLLVDERITSGLSTVAIRVPDKFETREILRASGPLAAPSANRFGRTSPTTAAHVESEFEGCVPVLDGGSCSVGIESTIVRFTQSGTNVELDILRPGGISREALHSGLESQGWTVIEHAKSAPTTVLLAPGALPDHYQPEIPLLVMEADEALEDTARVFGLDSSLGVELTLSDDARIAARELYSELRRVSSSGALWMYFRTKPGPDAGLWESINDRLARASTKRR